MGEMKIKISDATEKAFRKLAMHRFGYQRGALSEAAQEAIETWSEVYEEKAQNNGNLWDSLEGCMKHVKKTSVELQHEAWNSVVEKHIKKRKHAR